MNIALIGASNTIGALNSTIANFGADLGLTGSLILDKYYLGLLEGYKINPSKVDPKDSEAVLGLLRDAKLFSIGDMHALKQADVYVIDGTFGSLAASRVFNPSSISENRLRPTMMNFLNTTVVELANLYQKRLIVTESATLSRLRRNYTNNHYKKLSPKYYRMGAESWIGGLGRWCKPIVGEDRLEVFVTQNSGFNMDNIYRHEWRNCAKGFILLIASLEHDPTHAYTSVEEYVAETIHNLRKHTSRRILLKPHPESSIDFKKVSREEKVELLPKSARLADVSKGCYCAVMDDSTSLFELVNYGIPCVTSRLSFGASLGNCSISEIEILNYPSSQEMLEWYRNMACTEFMHAEFGSPGILKYLMELIDG